MNAKRVLVTAAIVAFLAAFVALLPEDPPVRRPAPPADLPPSAGAIAATFAADLGRFEAHRDLALSLASPDLTLQADFFAWGDDEQRTEMEPGRWWAPDESWLDTPDVLAAIGLDAARFTGLKVFLEEAGLHAIRKLRRFEDGETEVEFLFARGVGNTRVERVLIWHRDPRPMAQETLRRVSADRAYPQHMRETPLDVPGWFVRETIVDRP